MDRWALLAGALVLVIAICCVVAEIRDRARERHWRREIARRHQEARLRDAERRAGVGPNQYRCTGCGKVYDKGRDDAEAMAEALEVFGAVLNRDGPPCIVCDDCYRAIMGDDPPRLEPRS